MKYFLRLLTISLLFFASCKKDNTDTVIPPPTPADTSIIKSDLSLEFDHRVGPLNLSLNLRTYTNLSGESYTISKVRYFISNVKLTNTGDTIYTVPQDSSYFLIDESDFNTWFAKMKVPVGDYKILSFMIGVDSLRNTKDISQRTGVLDPTTTASDMYWSWNSGYIFFKIEGASPASTDAGNVFMYHVGGFGGYSSPTINNLRTVTLDLTTHGIAQVRTGRKSNLHLFLDLSKIFDGVNTISIAAHPTVMFDDFSANIADNYSQMFTHDHTEN